MSSQMINPIALRTAKTLWSFGCSECNTVKYHTHLSQIPVICSIEDVQFRFLISRHSGQHTVENMVISFIMSLMHDTRLLKQVLLNLGSFDYSPLVEVDIYVFAKSTGVVISDGLGIAKCWKKTFAQLSFRRKYLQNFKFEILIRIVKDNNHRAMVLFSLNYALLKFCENWTFPDFLTHSCSNCTNTPDLCLKSTYKFTCKTDHNI